MHRNISNDVVRYKISKYIIIYLIKKEEKDMEFKINI